MRKPFPRPDIQNTTLLCAAVFFWSISQERDAQLLLLGFAMAYSIILFGDFAYDVGEYMSGESEE